MKADVGVLYGPDTAFCMISGCELVMQGIIDDAPPERQAVYDHRAWLETIHLLTTLPAWSRNLPVASKDTPRSS
jgi:hypothetical protein